MKLITPQHSLQMGVNDWLCKSSGTGDDPVVMGLYKMFRESQPVRKAFARRIDEWASGAGENRVGMEGRSDALDCLFECMLDATHAFWGHLKDAIPICAIMDSTLEMNLPIPSLMVVLEVHDREKDTRRMLCLDMALLPEAAIDTIKELHVTDRDPLVIFFGEEDRQHLWEELAIRIAVEDI